MKAKYLYPLLFLCFCLGCKKEDQEKPLPKATQEGANTIGCKVNGKNWVAGGTTSGKEFTMVITPYDGLVISGLEFTKETNRSIILCLKNFNYDPGSFPLRFKSYGYPGEIDFESHGQYVVYDPEPRGAFITNEIYTGNVNITKCDTINRIIAGTFEFTAVKTDNSGETIKITDGRFDKKY